MPCTNNGSRFDEVGFRQSVEYFLGERSALIFCGSVPDCNASSDMADIFFAPTEEDRGLILSQISVDRQPSLLNLDFHSISEAGALILAALLVKHNLSPSTICNYNILSFTLAGIIIQNEAMFNAQNLFPDRDILGLVIEAAGRFRADDVDSYFDSSTGSTISRSLLKEKAGRITGHPGVRKDLDAVYDINASESCIEAVLQNKIITLAQKPGFYISALVLVSAPEVWLLQGEKPERVFYEVDRRLRIINASCGLPLSDEVVQDAIAVYIAKRAAFSPELASRFNIEGGHLLGLSVFSVHAESLALNKESGNQSNLHLGIFKGFLSVSDFKKNKIQERLFRHAVAHYPDIMNPENVVRTGARLSQWSRKVESVAGLMEPLSKIRKEGIWHPLLTRKEFAELADEEDSLGMLIDYLNEGAQWRRLQAEEVLRRGIVNLGSIIPDLTRKSQIDRLNELVKLEPEQFAKIKKKFKSSLIKDDFGL